LDVGVADEGQRVQERRDACFTLNDMGCLLATAGAGGRERVSAAAADRAGYAGREAPGCENCLLSSH